MGLSRRAFFGVPASTGTGKEVQEDVLFKKYSRKKPGRKPYTQELVDYKDIDNNTGARVNPVTTGLAPYTGTWGTWEALHLLRRTGYGYKKADVDTLSSMTMQNAVDAVLNINTTPPSPPVNWYEYIAADPNGVPYGGDWTNDAFSSNAVGRTSNKYRWEGLKRWSAGLALNQDITIREKMVWFWYHFIPVDFEAIYLVANTYNASNSARICYQYMKMFRDNALGNFKTIIQSMSTQPAMMYYLNNQSNTATAPDENFARELMELFTLGKDPLSQYTQADVIAAAQVLTGWRVQNLNTTATATTFDNTLHKQGSKQFSSFFNNTIIQGNGASELDDLINMIFTKTQVVSEYICRRLYRYFVYYDIDATIEANVITPLAQTFVAGNWNILPVLQQLFKSEHFYDMANRGVYIKSPLDSVLGSLRSFNLNYNVSDPTNHQAQYQVWGYMNDKICEPMAQVMGQVPGVAGWPAFYQSPAFHEYWISAYTTQRRFSWIDKIINGFNLTYNGLQTTTKIDGIAYIQQFPNAICLDPNLLVAECIKYLLPVDLSQAQKDSIKQQTLLFQQASDYYWTTAWTNYTGQPTNTSFKSIVTDRLKSLLYTITQLAEYQLM